MGILDDFEEKDSMQEEINKVLGEVQEQVGNMGELAKTKALELSMELVKVEKVRKDMEEELKNIQVLTEKMLEMGEIYKQELENIAKDSTKHLDEKIKNIQDENKLFLKALEEKEVFEVISKTSREMIQNVEKNVTYDLEKLQKERNKLIENLQYNLDIAEKRANRKEWGFWILLILTLSLSVFLFFSYKNVRSEIKENNKQYYKVMSILKQDSKFWYSEKDKKAYLSYIKDLEEQEKKSKK